MNPIKIDFKEGLNKSKILKIQKIFEKEGSFLSSEKIESGFRIIIDLDKSPRLSQAAKG